MQALFRTLVYLIALLAILAAKPAAAQVDLAVEYGVRAGLHVSTVTDYIQSGERKLAFGPGGGLVVHLGFGDRVFLHPELLLNARGVASKIKAGGAIERAVFRFYYLDFPVLVGTYAGSGKVRGYFSGGPQLSLGLFTQSVYEVTALGVEQKASQSDAWPVQFRRFELGWALEAGVRIDTGAFSALELGVRPVFGITPVVQDGILETASRNISFALTAAYYFAR